MKIIIRDYPSTFSFDTDWGRSLRDEYKETGVAYFFKQIDKVIEIPEDLMIREFYK